MVVVLLWWCCDVAVCSVVVWHCYVADEGNCFYFLVNYWQCSGRCFQTLMNVFFAEIIPEHHSKFTFCYLSFWQHYKKATGAWSSVIYKLPCVLLRNIYISVIFVFVNFESSQNYCLHDWIHCKNHYLHVIALSTNLIDQGRISWSAA